MPKQATKMSLEDWVVAELGVEDYMDNSDHGDKKDEHDKTNILQKGLSHSLHKFHKKGHHSVVFEYDRY